jgi:hypothetical protein
MKSKKLVMMALTIGVLMLTLSIIGTVAAYVPPEDSIHATVCGWGRVGRTRGAACLTVGIGTLEDHVGAKYILLEIDDDTYGWAITKVKQYRSTLYVYATSLGGHEGEGVGVKPGPGYLVMRVGMHGTKWAWVIAWGRRTFFIGS